MFLCFWLTLDLLLPCMRCSSLLQPLRSHSVTAFAGRFYTTTSIPAAGPSTPPESTTSRATLQDDLRRKRRTDWKRRQNVSTVFPIPHHNDLTSCSCRAKASWTILWSMSEPATAATDALPFIASCSNHTGRLQEEMVDAAATSTFSLHPT